jgi:adenine-specific DNA-methyltransferase
VANDDVSEVVLARNLLREDGVILVSIDDHEVHNLRTLMNEIFREENFIAQLVWEKGRKNDASFSPLVMNTWSCTAALWQTFVN